MTIKYESTPDGRWASHEDEQGSLTATIHRPMSGRRQWRICYARCTGKFAALQGKVEDRGTLGACEMRLSEHVR